MKNVEIEIQVQVEKIKPLLAFLKKNGKFVGKNRQIDRYFSPSHRDFLAVRPVNEWLRLRDSSGMFSVTYKNWHREKSGRTLYCDEFETPIEKIDQMERIFSVLNLKNITTVDKTREIWMWKSYEVAIDHIKGLGDFVEIEFKGKSLQKSPRKITEEMVQFLKDHDCGEIRRNDQGYPFKLLFPLETRDEIV